MKFVILLGALAGGLGCQAMNTPLYFNGTMALELTGQENPPRIKDALALRFRNPTMKEQQDLDARRAAADPVKIPWISREHVHVEVSFMVKNLDTAEGQFDFMVDGATEFIKYDEDIVAAAITGANQQPNYLPLMQSRPQILAAGATYAGTLREDDFAEAESDLDSIDQVSAFAQVEGAKLDPMNPDAPPFPAVLILRSDVKPTGMQAMNLYTQDHPGMLVVPAIIEVDVTFTANKHMIAQYLVRVRDDDDQLLHDTGDTRFNPTPALFTPAPPPPAP